MKKEKLEMDDLERKKKMLVVKRSISPMPFLHCQVNIIKLASSF